MRITKIYTIIFLFLALSLASCRVNSYDRNMKKIDDTKKEKAKEVQKQYDAAMDQHMKNQSKETRKHMKAHNKEGKKNRLRLFGKKERIGCGKNLNQ